MGVTSESPAEYFGRLVGEAIFRNQVNVCLQTMHYVVSLLCQFANDETEVKFRDELNQPLALRLKYALEQEAAVQRIHLRRLGDFSLFVSGFFPDSLKRSGSEINYYVTIGRYAYGSLSQHQRSRLTNVYVELARDFVTIQDVLSDVSEQSFSASISDLRLYEKWLRTGSSKTAKALIGRGIVPNASIGKKFIQ